MSKNEFASGTSFKSILDSLIVSYGERNREVDFPKWLSDKLCQGISSMSAEASEKLAEDIIAAVTDYDNTLNDLNRAVEAGQSEEEWLAERLSADYTDVPFDIAGEKLQIVDESITASDMQLMESMGETVSEEASSYSTESVGWNKYSIKNKIHEIGQKSALLGIAAAANAIKGGTQNGLSQESTTVISEAIQNDQKSEVKAVVATAAKVAAENHMTDLLPSDISTETASSMAGVAVEGAEALLDAANGDITTAIEKIGRAGVAAACHLCADALKGLLKCVPFGGVLSEMFGGVFQHVESPPFTETVYTVVHDTAVSAWNGIKKIGQGVKKVGEKIFSGLKSLFN